MSTPPLCRTTGAIDAVRFREEFQPLNRPVLMSGLVSHWPVVKAARQSDDAIGDYIKQFDTGIKMPVSVLPADSGGTYFYNEDVTGLNFRTVHQLLPTVVDRMLERGKQVAGDTYYLQSLPVETFLPRFAGENVMPLLAASVRPRVWIGNRLAIQTHYDLAQNLACCVAGRRRFTLFPPEQIVNLYPGPDDLTPGGTPVSMAPLDSPDFDRYPRLRDALAAASVVDMEPGDVLYLPYGWWHRVESLSGFNMLVNYWWSDTVPPLLPTAALKAALLSIRQLPAPERAVWKTLFDYYIFETNGDPVAHLAEQARGNYGELTPERLALLAEDIKGALPKRR